MCRSVPGDPGGVLFPGPQQWSGQATGGAEHHDQRTLFLEAATCGKGYEPPWGAAGCVPGGTSKCKAHHSSPLAIADVIWRTPAAVAWEVGYTTLVLVGEVRLKVR